MSGGEERDERVPGGEHLVAGDGAQVLEHAHTRAEPPPGLLPEGLHEVAGGVEGEGEEVEGDEHGGEGGLAVPEVVLEVVSVLLQDVEALVLDLPARAGALGEFRDVVGGDLEVGGEGVAVGDLAVRPGDLEFEPVDAEGVVGVADGEVPHPLVAVDAAARAAAGGDPEPVRAESPEVVVQRLVAAGLGGHEEVPALVEDGLADGLAGVQVVGEVDGPERGEHGAEAPQPALGRLALAVLLVVALAPGEELRGQRQREVPPGRDDGGGEHLVEVLDAAVGAPAARAAGALDVAGAEVLGAVEGDQHMPAQHAHGFEPPGVVEFRREAAQQAVEALRRHAVEGLPDVVVAGCAGQAEQGVQVRVPALRGERALVRQERLGLRQEHRQRRHADVAHGVHPVAAGAPVRQPVEAVAGAAQVALQPAHAPAPGYPASTAMIDDSTARRSAGGSAA